MVFKFYTTDRSYERLYEDFDCSANDTMWKIYEELSSEIVASEIVAEAKIVILKDCIYNEINKRVLNMINDSNLKENLMNEMIEIINNDKEIRKEKERKEKKIERENNKYRYTIIWHNYERNVDKYGYCSEMTYWGDVKDYDPEDEEDINYYKEHYKYDKRCSEPVNKNGYNIHGKYLSRCEHYGNGDNLCHCFEYR